MPDSYQDDDLADEREEEQQDSGEDSGESSRARSARHNKILARVRKNYRYGLDQWQEIRDEGREDMRFLTPEGGWPQAERIERKANNRPCMHLDELTQYCNQTINDVRQKKRGIRFTAVGAGANDKTAELREDIVRAYEYKSKANLARIMAFESALQRGYGYYRLGFKFSKSGSFEQEFVCLPIPNPDSVIIDPDCKMPDRSDMDWGFVLDPIRKTDFRSRYPKAKKQSFNTDDQRLYPDWAQQQTILLAEYWEREKETKTLYELADGSTAYADEYDGAKENVVDEREDEVVTVCQYITNGFEILEENEFPGDYIPIIMVSGKEMYVETKGVAKRVLMSLIRLARSPQQLYDYYRTCQTEIVGMVPKIPYIGAKGQFDGMEDIWASINSVPRAYAEYNILPEQAGGQAVPPPQRASYEPAIQALEMGAESARRAIQAACGLNPLPTSAQRQNEKSGVALGKIQQSEAQGSFHFTDNFDSAITHEGRIINGAFSKIIRGKRYIGIRKADDSHASIRINDPAWVNPQTKQVEHHDTENGEFDVTVSTGAADASAREEVNDFAAALAQNEAIFPRIADLVVRLKNLGPLGDQIADRLTPPEFAKPGSPQQMQGQVQQAQQQVKALNEFAKAAEAKIKELEQEKQAKVLENDLQYKKALLDAKVKIVIAEIGTKAQIETERAQMLADAEAQLHDHSHDAALAAADAGHEAGMAAQGHQQAGELADQNAANAQIAAQQQAEQPAAAQ